jgi:hypothetical protein
MNKLCKSSPHKIYTCDNDNKTLTIDIVLLIFHYSFQHGIVVKCEEKITDFSSGKI